MSNNGQISRGIANIRYANIGTEDRRVSMRFAKENFTIKIVALFSSNFFIRSNGGQQRSAVGSIP
jgi:hypothetical protein